MPIRWSCPARKTRQRPDGLALKKDQLIVQDLPVGRGQAHGPRVACRSIDRYTDKSLLHDVNEQDAMRLRRQNIARVEIGCMRLVEPTGIEPATSSLQS